MDHCTGVAKSSLFCNESACWPKVDMGVGVPSLCHSHITPTHSEALLLFTLQSFAYHLLCVHLVKLVFLGVALCATVPCYRDRRTEEESRKGEKQLLCEQAHSVRGGRGR